MGKAQLIPGVHVWILLLRVLAKRSGDNGWLLPPALCLLLYSLPWTEGQSRTWLPLSLMSGLEMQEYCIRLNFQKTSEASTVLKIREVFLLIIRRYFLKCEMVSRQKMWDNCLLEVLRPRWCVLQMRLKFLFWLFKTSSLTNWLRNVYNLVRQSWWR
jgi:hypothetical protein